MQALSALRRRLKVHVFCSPENIDVQSQSTAQIVQTGCNSNDLGEYGTRGIGVQAHASSTDHVRRFGRMVEMKALVSSKSHKRPRDHQQSFLAEGIGRG